MKKDGKRKKLKLYKETLTKVLSGDLEQVRAGAEAGSTGGWEERQSGGSCGCTCA